MSNKDAGPAGASASPGILYGYLGCYVQTGSPSTTAGRALPTYIATYSNTVNSLCSAQCLAGGYIFFGTVNEGTTGADCYCGNAITYVSVTSGLLGSVTGEAGENNCYPCNGASLVGGVPGECGNYTVNTISVFARSF